MSPIRLALLALALAACSSTERTVGLRLENDLGDLRNDYTHNTELWWSQPIEEAPGLLADVANSKVARLLAWPLDPDEATGTKLRYRVGQLIYTPVDVTKAVLQPRDRPFGAWLHAGVAIDRVRLDADDSRRRDQRSSLELDLGIVGPSALGKEVQTEWHSFWELQPIDGWQNQLHDEATLLLAGRNDWRLAFEQLGEREQLDLLGHADWSLGNLRTGLDLGGTLRFGRDLPRDFGLRSPGGEEHGGHLFVTGNLRLVEQDLFLNGNTSKDSHSVPKEDLVGEVGVGFSMRLGPMHLRLARTVRSDEFRWQHGTQGVWTLDLVGAL